MHSGHQGTRPQRESCGGYPGIRPTNNNGRDLARRRFCVSAGPVASVLRVGGEPGVRQPREIGLWIPREGIDEIADVSEGLELGSAAADGNCESAASHELAVLD